MLWRVVRGWSDSDMESSLPLVSIVKCLKVIIIYSSCHSTASPSTPVMIAICNLPKGLTPTWNKELLGDQMDTNVANLLDSSNEWKSKIHFYLFDLC